MKIVSWNVNGLRAAINKGFYDFFNQVNADLFGIQETKMQESQVDDDMKKLGNYQYWNSAEKKGYSGTAVFMRNKPLKVTYGDDNEGRVITCEYEDFFFVNIYLYNCYSVFSGQINHKFYLRLFAPFAFGTQSFVIQSVSGESSSVTFGLTQK